MESARTTTTSCRFVARTLAAALILGPAGAHAQKPKPGPAAPAAPINFPLPGTPMPIPGAAPQEIVYTPPETLPGKPVPIPAVPSPVLWTVRLPAAPAMPPVADIDRIFVASLPGIVSAHDALDGRELWRAELSPQQPLVLDGGRLLVAAGEALHALSAVDGAVAWRAPIGTLTAPILAKDGWIVIATPGRLTARRASDGSVVWTQESGAQREAATIAGDALFVPLLDGRMVALDLASGKRRWERRLGGAPGRPLVIGNRVVAGGSDKALYALDARSGGVAWSMRLGATIDHPPSSDGARVYLVARDNLVRRVDPDSGSREWHKGVPFRALASPFPAAGAVILAGLTSEIQMLRAEDGVSAGNVDLPERLAVAPAFVALEKGLLFAAITGGLAESWQLSLVIAVPRLPKAKGEAPAGEVIAK